MIISYEKTHDKALKLKNLFTVENKDIDRQQRIAKRDLPRLRTIKLFMETWWEYFFPIWQFSKVLERKKEKQLSQRLTYLSDSSKVRDDMVMEQHTILLDLLLDETHTGIINMKTWRGKGNMIIQMVEAYNQRTLILCHNIKTLLEMKEKFKKFSNYEPWLYYWVKKEIKEITITTHSSFVKASDKFRGKFGIVMYDECDYNLSEDMIRTLILCDCEWLFGFTWTPKTKSLSIKDLQLIYGNVYKSDQWNNWYNILPDITRIVYSKGIVSSFDHRHDLRKQMSEDKDRVTAQIDFVESTYKNNQMSLLLTDKVDDCTMYEKEFAERWIPCRIINWNTKPKDDEISIQDMLDQKWIIIWTYHKIWRGVDIPPIDCVYFYFPNSFDSTAIQAVGRALRSYPWKEKVTLYDWNDSPILWPQWRTRITTYKNEYKIDPKNITTIEI